MFALAALRRLGEATLDEVARELGVHCVAKTVAALETDGKVVGEDRWNSTLRRKQRWFRLSGQRAAS